MSRHGGKPSCASKQIKHLKTWWLSESRLEYKTCAAILLLMALILVPWPYIHGGMRGDDPNMFLSADASTVPVVDASTSSEALIPQVAVEGAVADAGSAFAFLSS